MNLFDLMAKITLDTSDYEKGLDESEEKAESFGTKLGTGLKTAGKIGAAAIGAVTVGAVAAGTAIVKNTNQLADYGDEIDKMSQKLGMSYSAYQEWDYVLGQAGAEITSMSTGLKTLTNKLDDAIQGTSDNIKQQEKLANAVDDARSNLEELYDAQEELNKQVKSGKIRKNSDEYKELEKNVKNAEKALKKAEDAQSKFSEKLENSKGAIETFERLGLSMDDLSKMSREDVFAAVITGFQGMEDSAERAALANDLFGKSGQELTPLFNSSIEDTNALRQAAHDLGFVLSDDTVKAAADYNDAMDTMKRTMGGVKNNIVGQFLPGITTVMDGLTQVFSGDSGSGIGQINEGISGVVSTITSSLPSVLSAGSQIIIGLASAITANLPQVAAAAVQIIPQIVLSISSMLPELLTSGVQIILEILSGLASAVPMVWEQAPVIITNLVNAIVSLAPMLITSGIGLIIDLINGLVAALPQLIAMAPDIIMTLVDAFIENAPLLLEAGMELLNTVVTGLVSLGPTLWDAGKRLVMGLLDRLSNITASFGVIGRNIITSIKDAVSQTFSTLSSVVSSKFNSIKTTISNAFSGAYNKVKEIVDKLKTIFNFSWSLPSIKLPHFSIGKGQTVLGVELPKITVSWYKKAYENPYMFNSPTVVGAMGFGDGNGGEMVYGHESLMRDIRDAVAAEMPKVFKLYLDGDKLVGGTSDRMDNNLGQKQVYQLRWEGA